MSTKVCIEPVKPEWSDAVTLGQLGQLIDALYGFGYDIDTPVTYLHDHDHVWLETIDDDDVVIVLERQPRVVELLTGDCRDAEWIRSTGERYRFDRQFGNWELITNGSSEWVNARVDTPGRSGVSVFTEVLS